MNPLIIKLAEIARLQQGWDTYGSPPITDAAIRMAVIVAAAIDAPATLRAIVPVPGGGIQFEFSARNGRELEIEILREGVIACYFDPPAPDLTVVEAQDAFNWLMGRRDD